MSQTRSTYFKPVGASSTLYLAQINANLSELFDGPLKDKMMISISKKEIAESLTHGSTALQSHLLWLMDLFIALPKDWNNLM